MTKKGVLALAVAAVVAAGTGTSIAAGTGLLATKKPSEDAWVQALSKRLGTTPDKLVEALQGVATDRIDALVADGTITKAQADKLKTRVTETGGLGFRGLGRGGIGPDGMGRRGHDMGGPGRHGRPGDPLGTAATYLGMTSDALDTALDGGSKLADILKEKVKTADGLKSALVAAAKKQIDALTVATDAQKKTMLDTFTAHVDALIASSLGHDRGVAGADKLGGSGGLGGPGGLGGFGLGGHGHHGGIGDMDGLPGLGTGPRL